MRAASCAVVRRGTASREDMRSRRPICRAASLDLPLASARSPVIRSDQMELGPTGSDTGRSWFLLSSGCNRS